MSRRLLKSTGVVSIMTFLSRIFGLIRDMVFATMFGATDKMDVFIVAFRIPNFLRRLFAEGGFSQAFVPILSEYKTQREQDDVKALVDQTAATLGGILIIVSVIGVLAAPALIWLFAPGFHNMPEKQALAGEMLRITFPYIFFISLTAFAGSVLNAYKQFAIPAFTPVLLNLSLISCALWLAPKMPEPIIALAVGVLIAGLSQLFLQFPFLFRLGLFPKPGLNRDREGVKRIIKLMIPALFATSIVQINLLVDTIIASFLQNGSISWLYYSDRMVEFPLGVFGIALATVILPSLSEKHAQANPKAFSNMLDWGLRWVFLIGLPAAVGLALLALPIMTTVFQHGEFTSDSSLNSAKSLMAYALGLPAFILIKILSAGFFSRQDTKTPVKYGAITMFVNIFVSLALVFPLQHVGLALATAITAWLQAILLFLRLKRDGVYTPVSGWPVYLLRLILALSVMVASVYAINPANAIWFDANFLSRVTNLLLCIGIGVLSYVLSGLLFGLRKQHVTASAETV